MALTASEIAKHLPALISLQAELTEVIAVVQLAREDKQISPAERLSLRRAGVRLMRASLPVLLALAVDVVD